MEKPALANQGQKKPVPVRERTYKQLKSKVLSGDFNQGQRLTEEYLARKLGVSRTPVREALHKLESEGLIKQLETRGFCVARDSREEMEDLFDIRAALEGYAIRLICECISEKTVNKLNGLIQKADDALIRKKLDEVFEYNTQFHDTLHEVLAGKTRFHSLIADIRKYVLRYRKDSLHYLEGAKKTIEGHRKILFAISLKDPDLCERIMRKHVQEAKEEALHKNSEDNKPSDDSLN
jgi:DNA-binding GntR family transcriptional regulator